MIEPITIENVGDYEVTFLRMDTDFSSWVNAYVRFDYPNNRHEYGYPMETYNEGNTYGVDTNHLHNDLMSIEERKEDARRQIMDMIEIHDGE